MKELSIGSTGLRGGDPAPKPKRRSNRQARVPEILEAAIKVFAAEGNAGFTQRRVAQEAGILLGTLQHYFGTREELLRSAIQEMATRNIGEYREMAKDKTRTPEARLERIFDQVFSQFMGSNTYQGTFALHCWSLAEQESSVNDLVAEVQGEVIDLFAALIAKINISLTASECTLRAELICSHLYGLIVFIRRCGDNEPDWEAFRAATKAVCKAVCNAPQ